MSLTKNYVCHVIIHKHAFLREKTKPMNSFGHSNMSIMEDQYIKYEEINELFTKKFK